MSPRARTLAVLAGVMVLAAGCSAGGGKRASAQSAAAAPSTSGAATTAAGAPKADEFTGIVVAHCDQPTVTLYAFDPNTTMAEGTVREFTVGADSKWVGCMSHVQTGLFRQQFNAAMDKMAVSFSGQDGGGHVGYVQADTGSVVDLTPSKSDDYAGITPAQSAPVFNPVTGALWYFDEKSTKHYGWYDPAGPGKPHEQSVLGKYFADMQPRAFYFSSDGTTAFAGEDQYGPVTPDGKHEVYNDPQDGFHVVQPGQPEHYSELYPSLSLPANAKAPRCEPVTWVDDTTFLCVGDGTTGQPRGLYKMTISGKRLTQVPLLPESENIPVSPVVSPDRTQVAFLAGGTGNSIDLYKVSLNGGNPTRVAANIPASLTTGNQVVGWF